jgi:putative FmdB family regulatory protein
MPIYEYTCRECGKDFIVQQSVAAHSRGPHQCPHCQSTNVQQKVSTIYTVTSRKS